MTYEQRVQHMAEKMADRYISPDHVIKERRGDAKIAVAAQAEAIREALLKFFYRNEERIDQYLIENGYIITSTTNVEQPSNPLPVSPDKENTCPLCGGETHTEYFTDGQNSTQIQPTYCLDCKWTQGNKI